MNIIEVLYRLKINYSAHSMNITLKLIKMMKTSKLGEADIRILIKLTI